MGYIRGYAGFFNGHYIRSSYEYVMANILIKQNKNYVYEERTYYLNLIKKNYKPDFTIYNEDGSIDRIIEVKGGRGKQIVNALERAKALEYEYGIKVYLYDYAKLEAECDKSTK